MKISDYGPGVPKDELELITNKFYRGKSWAESKADGNGPRSLYSKNTYGKNERRAYTGKR